MKQKKIFSYLLLAISLTLFTACNGENDVKDDILQTPTYENVSAKFEITDSHSDISSLELTASGNYIVINKKYKSKTDRNTEIGLLPNGMLQADAFATRASVYGNIIYGKFTAIGENSFRLEGYGIVTITTNDNIAYTLDIELEDGSTTSIGARKEKVYDSSDATNKLSRTWEMETFGYKVQKGNNKFEKAVNHNNIEQLFIEYYDWLIIVEGIQDEKTIEKMKAQAKAIAEQYNNSKPQSVIFTKSGSYIVGYNNGAIGISTWMWENEDEGVLRYSWDTTDIYNGGLVDISFTNNILNISETQTSGNTSVTTMYGLKEMK
jgi:hypothetical protein